MKLIIRRVSSAYVEALISMLGPFHHVDDEILHNIRMTHGKSVDAGITLTADETLRARHHP